MQKNITATRLIILFFLILISLNYIQYGCAVKNNTIRDEMSKELSYTIQEGLSLYQKGKYLEAEKRFLEALQQAKILDNIFYLIEIYLHLGELYITLRQYDTSEKMIYFAQIISDTESYHELDWRILFVYGKLYADQGKYQKALECYFSALGKNKSAQKEAEINNNIGFSYLRLNDLANAEKFLFKAYEANKVEKNYINLGNNAYNIGILYKMHKKYNAALTYLYEALQYDKISETVYGILLDLYQIADAWLYLGDKKKALYYANRALENAKLLSSSEYIKIINDFILTVAK